MLYKVAVVQKDNGEESVYLQRDDITAHSDLVAAFRAGFEAGRKGEPVEAPKYGWVEVMVRPF